MATVTHKGQVTIPVQVRNHLGLKVASQLAFVVETDGTVQLKAPKYPSLESVMGAVKPLVAPMTGEMMRDAIEQDRVEQFNAKLDRAASVNTDPARP